MEIQQDNKMIEFFELEDGEVFQVSESGYVYMRLEEPVDNVNTVNLKTGRLAFFKDDDEVIHCKDAFLTI